MVCIVSMQRTLGLTGPYGCCLYIMQLIPCCLMLPTFQAYACWAVPQASSTAPDAECHRSAERRTLRAITALTHLKPVLVSRNLLSSRTPTLLAVLYRTRRARSSWCCVALAACGCQTLQLRTHHSMITVRVIAACGGPMAPGEMKQLPILGFLHPIEEIMLILC